MRAGQRALQELRQAGGAHPQGTGALLVDAQVHHLARLFPIQVHIHHVRVLAHLVGDLARQFANLRDVLAGNPELLRIAHRRPVLQATDAAAQVREVLVHPLDQPLAQRLAALQVLGQHHHLGEAGRRQLLVQRQVEAGRAGADVGHVVVDAVMALQHFFQALDFLAGRAQ